MHLRRGVVLVGFTIVLLTGVTFLISGPGGLAEQTNDIITIGQEELHRVQFIVFQGDALDVEIRGMIRFKLGPVWDTADIVMFKNEEEEIGEKRPPIGDLKGLFTIKVGSALLEYGGVLLSFGAYSREVYIGRILNEELEFLTAATTIKTIKTSELAGIELRGGTIQLVFLDGRVDDSPKMLISPLRIERILRGAITGRILDKEFEFELTDPQACPDEIGDLRGSICVIEAKNLFIIDIEEDGESARIMPKLEVPIEELGEAEEGEAGQPPEGQEGPVEVGRPPPPPPSFAPQAPAVGETVKFWYPDPDDPGSPAEEIDGKRIITWKWSFGDGATSTEPEPTHAYSEPTLWPQVYRACVTLTLEDGTQIPDRCRPVDVWLEGRWLVENVELELSIWEKQGDIWGQPLIDLDLKQIDYILIHQQPTPALGSPIIICPLFCL